MDFKSLDVNELVILAKANDDSAFSEISSRYTPMLCKQVSELSFGGIDDELLNEARVGLHKAVMSYDITSGKASFGFYASTCVRNHLLDFISKSRNSRINSESLDVENIAVPCPVQSRLEREESIEIIKSLAHGVLSDYEYRVFLLWLSGYKTAEIAERLSQSPKSVDNAKNRMFKHLKNLRDTLNSILN